MPLDAPNQTRTDQIVHTLRFNPNSIISHIHIHSLSLFHTSTPSPFSIHPLPLPLPSLLLIPLPAYPPSFNPPSPYQRTHSTLLPPSFPSRQQYTYYSTIQYNLLFQIHPSIHTYIHPLTRPYIYIYIHIHSNLPYRTLLLRIFGSLHLFLSRN